MPRVMRPPPSSASLSLHECLQQYAARLERVEAALGRTWAIQMGLVALGLYGLWNGWHLLGEATRGHLGLTLVPRATSLTLGSLLLYGYVRLGFLISQFLDARRECDVLFKVLHPKDVPMVGEPPPDVFASTNFFEPLYSGAGLRGWGGGLVKSFVILVAGAVTGVGNALTLLLTSWAGQSTIVCWVCVGLAGLIVGCYALALTGKSAKANPALRALVVTVFICAAGMVSCAMGRPPLLGIKPLTWSAGDSDESAGDLAARARHALADVRVAAGKSAELARASAAAMAAGDGPAALRLKEEAELERARGRSVWTAIEREIGALAVRPTVLDWFHRTLGEDAADLEELVTRRLTGH